MKTATRTILLLGGMVLLLAVVCATAQAGTYVLKFNHVLGAKEPYHQGFTNWAKAVVGKWWWRFPMMRNVRGKSLTCIAG